jgi:hypothetical protein
MTTTDPKTLLQDFQKGLQEKIIKERKIPPSQTVGVKNKDATHESSIKNILVLDSPHYRRMFKDLKPYKHAMEPLLELGRCGGLLDANPNGHKLPEDRLSGIPAGFTYFGQFLDHNITLQDSLNILNFDPGQQPENLANIRSGRINLEQVYGLGPTTQGFLFYDTRPEAEGQLYLDHDRNWDVPRRSGDHVPLIADPRNDTNVIVLQLHLAFMKFHNIIAKAFMDTRVNGKRVVESAQVFPLAQQQVAWHFQWLIINEFCCTFSRKKCSTTFWNTAPSTTSLS